MVESADTNQEGSRVESRCLVPTFSCCVILLYALDQGVGPWSPSTSAVGLGAALGSGDTVLALPWLCLVFCLLLRGGAVGYNGVTGVVVTLTVREHCAWMPSGKVDKWMGAGTESAV